MKKRDRKKEEMQRRVKNEIIVPAQGRQDMSPSGHLFPGPQHQTRVKML